MCRMRLVWFLAVVVFLAGCSSGSSVVGDATSQGSSEVVSSELDYVQQMIALERASTEALLIVVDSSQDSAVVLFAEDVLMQADSDVTILEYWLDSYYAGASSPADILSARSLRLESGDRLSSRYAELLREYESEKLVLSEAVLELSPRKHVRNFAEESVASSRARIDSLERLND